MDAQTLEEPSLSDAVCAECLKAMTENKQNKAYKKFLLFLVGVFLLVLGITLILFWWDEVVALFQGALGLVIALSGMVILYYLKK